MPDAAHGPIGVTARNGKGQPRPVDAARDLLEFARHFPALIGPDGYPLSWAHYQWGIREIRRHYAKQSLRMAAAFRAGQSTKDEYKQWVDLERMDANW